MMIRYWKILGAIVVALGGATMYADTPRAQDRAEESRIDSQQSKLDRIKKEIDDHRRKSRQLKKDEQAVMSRLSSLDKEIDLSQQFLAELHAQEQLMTEHIDSLQNEIGVESSALATQEAVLAQRLRQMYKRDPRHRWDMVLGSATIQAALNRYKFMQLIAEQDADMIANFRGRKTSLVLETASVTEALADIAVVRQDRQEESDRLASNKKRRSSMLKKIRGQKSQHAKAIKALKKSQEEVKNLIDLLEKKRAQDQFLGDGKFAELKGKMIWPVEGRIVRKYGKQTHPKYGTVTFNNGVDIRASAGTPIRCVSAGVVEFVDWIDAYGKCIIVNHGSGYYTLYAHVAATFVAQGQQVEFGAVIAEVGDSGSLDGFVCHFEIRQGKKALNPSGWLGKKKSS